ncbi:MAG: DnaB-like helicase C-terminal domain-containing protein, partial [Planctomycetota bacterium]
MTTDTIPGEDVTAEAMVLGALLCEPSMIPTVRAVLHPEHFYRPEHAVILRTLYRMADAGNCSVLAVKNAMAADGTLASIGQGDKTDAAGTDYLRTLFEDCSFDMSNLGYNASCIRNAATLRELIRLGVDIQADARRTAAHDVGDLLAKNQARLFELDQRGDAAGKPSMVSEAVLEGLEHAAAVKAGTIAPGQATGFPPLDRALCGGFHPGDLITLAAATSVGKTAMGLTVAANVARDGGAVFFVSCEMDRRAIGYRLLAAEARIPA